MFKKENISLRKFLLIVLSSLLAIFLLSACGNKDEEDNAGSNNDQGDMPEPDLSDLPDIVAEVNGEDITKEEFEGIYRQQFEYRVMMQQVMNEDDIDQDELKQETLESVIGQKLLVQEADKRYTDIDSEAIDHVIDDLINDYDMGSREEMIERFEEQGITEEELMSDIELQAKVNLLIDDETKNSEPTDEEIKEAYEEIKAEFEQMEDQDEEAPEFDEIKDDLRERMKQQNANKKVQDVIKDLREKSDVTLHI